MKLSFLPWLFASALLVGCGDDAGVGGEGGGVGGGPEGGGPPIGGGGQVDPNPILEREPAISHNCTEERPMSSDIGATNARLEGLVAFGGEFFVTTFEETLDLAKVDLDGSVGSPLALVDESFAASASLTISDDTGVVTVWSQGGQLNIARIDGELGIVDGPTAIPESAGNSVSAGALVATASGFALLYGAVSGSTTSLYFLALGSDGQATGDSVLVAELGEQYGAQASMTPTGDGGFAVAYSAGSALEGSIMFLLLDGDGSPRFEPRRISQPPGGGLSSNFSYYSRRNVMKVGDEYWVTFTESVSDFDAQEGSIIVRVAVVDAEGNATLHALQAPVDQIENRYPTFVELADGVGLAWTSGNIIWVCGGCITDYDMHFVVLDRDTLVPASEVVTHLHQDNGINGPIIAVDGDDLLTGANLDFHALTIPATGAMRCVASE